MTLLRQLQGRPDGFPNRTTTMGRQSCKPIFDLGKKFNSISSGTALSSFRAYRCRLAGGYDGTAQTYLLGRLQSRANGVNVSEDQPSLDHQYSEKNYAIPAS
jgi:hypothetical protein